MTATHKNFRFHVQQGTSGSFYYTIFWPPPAGGSSILGGFDTEAHAVAAAAREIDRLAKVLG